MATPQDPQAMAAMVDGMAAKRMGVEPKQEAPQKEGKKEDSVEGQAAEKGSPETEGDKIAADAIIYEIEFGEGDSRKLTPQQIKSTFERYSALNYKNAQVKPIMDLVEQVMRANPGVSTKQMADQLQNILRAQESNPTLGNVEGKQSGEIKPKDPSDLDSMLTKWEEDNAASLPPGYKDMLVGGNQTMAQMQQQLAATQQMLRQVMAQTQGVADAAKAGVASGQQKQVNAVRQQIANNIDRVQQALQLPDDKANDFMVFAAERGYTMEDFVDTQLTARVMQDFKNNMDSPEMDRMRSIAQRRQAFTGSLGSTPASSPSGQAAQGESTFDKFSNMAMQKRGIA